MSFFRIDAQPARIPAWVLSWFLFAAGIAIYFYAAEQRHRENPDDRVMPTVTQMVRAFQDAAAKPADGEKSSRSMLVTDTLATGRRFLISVALLFPAVLLGLHMAMFPYLGAFFLRFFQFFDKIVALSLLPILFIAFGIDELSKIMLIVIGVAPTIILDTVNLTKSVPREQIVKGFTLGAGDFAITYRIVLKQIFPRVSEQHPAEPEGGDAVSLRGRNDRVDRRAGLSHRAAAQAHGDGHDSSLCIVGGAAAVRGRPRDEHAEQKTSSLVSRMSISIQNVAVDYASRRILNGIDLEIDAGEFVSIVGETGCGKSTLLRLILAEERPTEGRVLVQGRERSRPDRTCGYVPQKYSLFPDKTVLDNVTFGLDVTSRGFFRKRGHKEEALRYLRHTGLNEADAKNIRINYRAACSSAWRSRRLLIMKPPVLLMDEAFSALDPGTRRGMQRLIKICGGRAVRRWCSSPTIRVRRYASEPVLLRLRKTASADHPSWSIWMCLIWTSIPTKRNWRG